MKLALLAFVFILGNAFAQTSVRPINTNLPTLFIAGDSTASNVDHRGWGDPFADYFDLSKINVANRARAGRSARTVLEEGLLGGEEERFESKQLAAIYSHKGIRQRGAIDA